MDLLTLAVSFLKSWRGRSASGVGAPATSHRPTDVSEIAPQSDQTPIAESRELELKRLGIGLNEKSKYSGGSAKLKNFQPSLIEGRWELSTFCLDELGEIDAWAVLDAASNKAPIPARTEISKLLCAEVKLSCDPNWIPERHVNILDWPADEPARSSIAQKLKAEQHFFLRNIV